MPSLIGRKEICTYCERSWKTVRYWIQAEDFPAAVLHGVWESRTELIDQWKEQKIMSMVKDKSPTIPNDT